MQAVIQPLGKNEYGLLNDFLYMAIFVPAGCEQPDRSILDSPELRIYVEGFGSIPGDVALKAMVNGRTGGLVWSRIMNDYGHVAPDVPSLAIAVREDLRGQGIGTQLLSRMHAELRTRGYSGMSLSVQKANRAIHLYTRVGFRPIRETDEEYVMLWRF